MANFAAHMAGGMAAGAGTAAVGLQVGQLSLVQAGAIFILGTVGGLLPDLDADAGKPLEIVFSLVAVLVPSLLLPRFTARVEAGPEIIICYFTLAYVLIKYGACSLIRRVTRHRGILHSIPFAILCGLTGFWLFTSSGTVTALYAGGAVLLGCIVHLVLDEFSSFTFRWGCIPALKRSSGTALKWRSDDIAATIFCYFLIVISMAAIAFKTSQPG